MKIRTLEISAILTILLLASCTAAAETPTSQLEPTAPQATQAPPAAPTRDPARYYNDEGGFSLLLPEGWSAIGPFEASGETGVPYNLYVLGVDPSPSGGPGASKVIVADAASLTAEEFALAQCNTCPSHPFEDVTLSGVPARRTLVGGDGVPFTLTWVFIENEGKLIGLAIHDSETLEPIEEVLQSIQFE